MNRITGAAILFCAMSAFSPQPASAVTIDTVPVGDAGNINDSTGFGGVAYQYRIGTYEVTNAQYVDFLNAKDATGVNTLGLYNSGMTSNAVGGIIFTAGNADGLKYSVKSDRGDNPVVLVSWYDSIRFANWLNNGQGAGDTESGAYTLRHDGSPTPTPIPSNGNSITRNGDAAWFVTSADEWYKAAYYQPAAQGGDPSNYWNWPTRTNDIPFSVPPPGITAPTPSNTVNYRNGNQFAVTGAPFDSSQNYLTDVGAYTQSSTFYGTFDQGGNAFEWNEEPVFDGSSRMIWGSSWSSPEGEMFALSFNPVNLPLDATHESIDLGFRVATVTPEPSSLVLTVMGLLGLAAWRWRQGNLASVH